MAESAANGSVTGSPSAGAVREELDQRVLLQSGQDSVLNGLRGAPVRDERSIKRKKKRKFCEEVGGIRSGGCVSVFVYNRKL